MVDRFGDWLWMQLNREALPPIIEARGRYLLHALKDRSGGGQQLPELKGEAAPQPLEVMEHGTRHLVWLGSKLSPGIFLDQRPQRAWLAQHAGGMRLLNTFAHAGAFSIAAARGGAETLSIDLSRSWLAQIPPQLALNGLESKRHDQIYGDVFDWLRRLSRRGERFDLLILDPPSTSVGKRKRRWSAHKDYAELVHLAAPLLNPGGRLWTATNHRKSSVRAFAQRVMRGLPEGTRLERVCPPALDFPSDEPAFVKTLVWQLPN